MYACPVDRSPLVPTAEGLRSASGRIYPRACGGWDLRPGASDANAARQAEIYDGMHGEPSNFDFPHNLTLLHQRQLLLQLQLKPGDRVLEIGGHRSGVLPFLEAHFGVVGMGLDISPAWVSAQNEAAAHRGTGTEWVLGDAETLPFVDKSFAAVVAFDVFEHISHLDRAVAEVARVLRPAGRLACHLPVQDISGSFDGFQRRRDSADFAARQASVGHYHERMPSRAKMRTLLEHVGLQVLDMQSFNVWLQPLHDHRLLPALGRWRHRKDAGKPASGPAASPTASPFQKVYARMVIPFASALTSPDRIGALLGIGGSCSYLAFRP